MEILANYSPACGVYLYVNKDTYYCGGCQIEEKRIFRTQNAALMQNHLSEHRMANQPVPESAYRNVRTHAAALEQRHAASSRS